MPGVEPGRSGAGQFSPAVYVDWCIGAQIPRAHRDTEASEHHIHVRGSERVCTAQIWDPWAGTVDDRSKSHGAGAFVLNKMGLGLSDAIHVDGVHRTGFQGS